VKVSATVASGGLQKRLARLLSELEPAALDAAADALATHLKDAREREGPHAPLLRDSSAHRRSVGAGDPESIARELGGPTESPAPWLAPVLPGRRAPMRAAAQAAVRAVLKK
jgi:hypothetical protein